jgi:hypothetical protein
MAMFTKIISGGQTGAERAALNVAIKFNIPHSGWIPLGRNAEDGPISNKYQLSEMPITSYSKKTEQNVLHADGNLIVSHGSLSGSCSHTKKIAIKHGLPWYHVNLTKTSIFQSALLIFQWIEINKIRVLNVTGPKVSEESTIYEGVKNVLEAMILLEPVKDRLIDLTAGPNDKEKKKRLIQKPESVEETVDYLISEMAFKYQISIANSSEDELIRFYSTIGLYIGNRFLNPRNKKLLESCRRIAQDNYLNWAQVPMVILKESWKKLRETHRLRVVK